MTPFYNIKDGYVFYDRGSEKLSGTYWRIIHDAGVQEAKNIKPLFEQNLEAYKAAGDKLIALGHSEREKERRLIERATGTRMNDEDIKEFIQKFNEVLIGTKQFKEATKRLKAALSEAGGKKNVRAPTASSWYTSKLNSALAKNINKFIEKNFDQLVQKDFSKWDAEFDKIINKSITQAFKDTLTKMEKAQGKEMYGGKDTWAEVYAASQLIEGFNQEFVEAIRDRIDFNKLKKIFSDEKIKLQNKKKTGVSTYIKNELDFKSGSRKSRSIGGSVQEYVQNVMEGLGEAASTATGKGHKTFKSNILSTDTVSLYSYDMEIDIQSHVNAILNEFNNQMSDNESLEAAARKMEWFYNERLSKLNDSFIVYGSTKSYSLSDSFRGFHKGGKQQLEKAMPYLSEGLGRSTEETLHFIRAAYSTANGAILHEKRAEYMNELKAGLMASIAQMLFDDWITMGDYKGKGAAAIHVLQLEGIEIPLSALLIATGKAMIEASGDMERFVNIKISLPKEIIYDTPIEIPADVKSPGDYMKEKWREQADLARKEASFSVKFLINFKSIIKQWID